MSQSHSVQLDETVAQTSRRIAAIVYADEAYPEAMFVTLVETCRALGLSLAGVLQHPAFEGADRRCDVLLEDLASGHRTLLFEDRGRGARGCRLNESALAEATARIEGSLEKAPQLLVLSKFGKVECAGGGLRDLIASAIDRDIPVVIGVPRRNLKDWRCFVGEFAVEFDEGVGQIRPWLEQL